MVMVWVEKDKPLTFRIRKDLCDTNVFMCYNTPMSKFNKCAKCKRESVLPFCPYCPSDEVSAEKILEEVNKGVKALKANPLPRTASEVYISPPNPPQESLSKGRKGSDSRKDKPPFKGRIGGKKIGRPAKGEFPKGEYVSFRLTSSTLSKLDSLAKSLGLSRAEVIIDLIEKE